MTTPEFSDADIEELARFVWDVHGSGEPWGALSDIDRNAWRASVTSPYGFLALCRSAAALLRRERARVARETLTITLDDARAIQFGASTIKKCGGGASLLARLDAFAGKDPS